MNKNDSEKKPTTAPLAPEINPNKNTGSDQSKYDRGIREVTHDTEDAQFIELGQGSESRRDSEESKYDEAGQRVKKPADPKNPEGSKISNSKPQESL